MSLIRQSLDTAQELVAIPVRTATSKTAQKAYLGTALFGLLASILFGISTISFLVFYNVYIPKIGIERPLHLQFGQGHPFARTDLGGGLTSNQPYDVSITLVLPKTPSNIAAGNFMLDMALLPPNASQLESIQLFRQILDITSPPIVRSKRSAILTYTSPVVDLAQTLSALPLYTFGWRQERETIEVRMLEGIEFRRGAANIPDQVQLLIEADEKMQFYSAFISIYAKFQGLRWILYHYKVTSFVVFTSAFFIASLASTLLIYLGFTFGTSSAGKDGRAGIKKEIKTEAPEDVPSGKSGFPSDIDPVPATIKQEDFDSLESSDLPPPGGEADDEDEYDETYDGNTSGWRDSGIGTGREDTQRSGKKRRSYAS